MTSAYKMHTRDSIRRRLGTMDTQIDAIETMANNIQDEFRSTRVVSDQLFIKTTVHTV